jgi:hypothetical protein
MKPSLKSSSKSSSAIYDYVKAQHWIFARFGNKKQTRRQNMAEIVFSWEVSEIKCIIFKENNSGRLMLGSCFALPTLDLICPPELHTTKHI